MLGKYGFQSHSISYLCKINKSWLWMLKIEVRKSKCLSGFVGTGSCTSECTAAPDPLTDAFYKDFICFSYIIT